MAQSRDFRLFLQTSVKNSKPVFFDGAMGTMIQSMGVTDFGLPEELNFTHEDLIRSIHEQYITAGSNVITANSFGANTIKMAGSLHSAAEASAKAISLIKQAAEKVKPLQEVFTAIDIGPTGHLLEPMGKLSFDEAYEAFKECAVSAECAGADLAIIETMSDLYETKAAVLAVKENTNLPIVAMITFQSNLRTLTGADVLTCVTYLEGLGVDALGFNCGGSLEEAQNLADQFLDHASIPLIAQPNAGIPVVERGRTIFKVGPEDFARVQEHIRLKGFDILGGCCGTTPDHIKAMIASIEKLPVKKAARYSKKTTAVCSYEKTVLFDNTAGSYGPVIIGERINPTGKKKMKEALLSDNMSFILHEAEVQLNAGAHILDVNVGLPGIDETQMMIHAVKAIQKSYAVPLQLDSSEAPVLEKAMRYYNGKPLVNSVNGKLHVMESVFPLIKKYGGCVVALCLDEDGIPPTAEGRAAVAKKILTKAKSYGIDACNIVFDTLTLTISSQQKEAAATLHAISMIKNECNKHEETRGVKTVLGVSNISFGLPRRDIINAHFFSMALFAGLDACIINPLSADMMNAYRTYRAVGAFDANCLDFIETYSGTQAPSENAGPSSASISAGLTPQVSAAGPGGVNNASNGRDYSQEKTLKEIIIKGWTEEAAAAAEDLLSGKTSPSGKPLLPLEIINDHIVTALDIVGKEYETGKKFLPQLLLSAETVSKSFEVIKKHLASTGEAQETKGDILIATVHGDIHDIGKNIVKAMLENYGYSVTDLGKDVKPELVVKTACEKNIPLVGLSALMTTTVISMEKTIQLLREAEKETGKKFSVMVGGAVLSEDFAQKIGADFYAKDAMVSVAIAKKFFGK
ncbi:MAG TPA: homocysteine S-methyltransferase family protein [Treponemataceae bacterium]|nr:homocysteine S-methyltransferase family protein [Treponemataceae bacterium]